MSFQYGGKIVTSGLALYLDAMNSKAYPGSGTTWSDLSNNKINATLNGSPTYDGKSFVFPTSADYARISYTSLLDLPTTHTLECWVKLSNIPLGDGTIIRAGDGIDQQYTFFFRTGGLGTNYNKFSYSYYDTGISNFVYKDFTTTAILERWHHVAAAKNGTSLKLYLNGQLDSSVVTTTSVPSPFNYIQIGALNVSVFGGNISTISMYNRELSAAEVSQNYNALKGRFGL